MRTRGAQPRQVQRLFRLDRRCCAASRLPPSLQSCTTWYDVLSTCCIASSHHNLNNPPTDAYGARLCPDNSTRSGWDRRHSQSDNGAAAGSPCRPPDKANEQLKNITKHKRMETQSKRRPWRCRRLQGERWSGVRAWAELPIAWSTSWGSRAMQSLHSTTPHTT